MTDDSTVTRDTRPTAELIALAVQTDDEEAEQEIVAELHRRGTEVELLAAQALCRSSIARERGLGCDLLGQLGSEAPTHLTESVDLLIEMLADAHEDVVASASAALGHRRDERAAGPLAALVAHPSPEVRFGVAFGLGGLEDERAVAALLLLSADEDEEVRDWATFGLGSLLDLDTPEIRAALLARADDENLEARAEAIVGLARRRAPETLDLLRREIDEDRCSTLIVEAAEALGDPALGPILVEMRESLEEEDEEEFGERLDAAIRACSPGE